MARQEALGQIDARRDPELMGGAAKQPLELVDEVRRRHLRLARDCGDRECRLRGLHEQVARPAQAAEANVSQQHEHA
jgi:hypothetical protein